MWEGGRLDYGSDYVVLLIIAVLALVIPLVVGSFKRVKLPIVVAEILSGIVIGRSGLDLVHTSPTLNFLAEFGFTFLMFLAGLEVSFESLRGETKNNSGRWTRPLPLAVLFFLITLTASQAVGLTLLNAGLVRDAVLMGLILSTTSMGVVVPVLKERKLIATDYGQLILLAALISDFVTLLLLSVEIAVVSNGFQLDLLLFLVLFAAFLAAARIGRWVSSIPVLPKLLGEMGHATSQIEVRGAFAIMIAWVVLSEALGIELILGAFLAGVVVSLSVVKKETRLHEKLDAIGYGFFIPIFFITVGANFDLAALTSSPTAILLVLILIGAAYFVKLVPSLIFGARLSIKDSLVAGVLLSSRLSLIIAATSIAFELDMISSTVNSAIILVAIISCTLSPMVFNRLTPLQSLEKRDGVVILGTNQLAALIGQRLVDSGEKVIFIGRDSRQLAQLQARGFMVVSGEPTDIRVLTSAGIATARSILILSNSPQVIEETANTAKRYSVPTIVARADEPSLVENLKAEGVRVVQPAMAVALALEGAIHYPATFDMMIDKGDGVDLRDIPLTNPDYFDKSLRDIHLPGGVLIIGVRRPSEVVVPDNDTLLRGGDLLLLIGSEEGLAEAEVLLSNAANGR
jgi:Kef-type K+ transport system membrane component KefB/Trk K+ transport system NAD-binding subunit